MPQVVLCLLCAVAAVDLQILKVPRVSESVVTAVSRVESGLQAVRGICIGCRSRLSNVVGRRWRDGGRRARLRSTSRTGSRAKGETAVSRLFPTSKSVKQTLFWKPSPWNNGYNWRISDYHHDCTNTLVFCVLSLASRCFQLFVDLELWLCY